MLDEERTPPSLGNNFFYLVMGAVIALGSLAAVDWYTQNVATRANHAPALAPNAPTSPVLPTVSAPSANVDKDAINSADSENASQSIPANSETETEIAHRDDQIDAEPEAYTTIDLTPRVIYEVDFNNDEHRSRAVARSDDFPRTTPSVPSPGYQDRMTPWVVSEFEAATDKPAVFDKGPSDDTLWFDIPAGKRVLRLEFDLYAQPFESVDWNTGTGGFVFLMDTPSANSIRFQEDHRIRAIGFGGGFMQDYTDLGTYEPGRVYRVDANLDTRKGEFTFSLDGNLIWTSQVARYEEFSTNLETIRIGTQTPNETRFAIDNIRITASE